jgi:peptidoglycan/LPS O-acetylase OafA/YrhL
MVRPGVYATPLWSLKWEVVFSLLLPMFLVAATFTGRRWWPVKAFILLTAVAIGQVTNQFWLFYLPMFGIGVVMAAAREDMGRLARRLNRPRWIVWSVVAVLFLTAQWTVGAFVGIRASEMWLPKVLGVAGAALCVFIFSSNAAAIRIGSSSPLQWLGKRSFSLYLVHEPIIVTVAFALSLSNGWASLLISLPISLLASAGFYILCEAPSHRLANQVGRFVDNVRRTCA